MTAPTPPAPRTRFSLRIRVQIGLILVVSLATLVCTWQFSQAGGAYQDAVREDVKRQAAVQEDVRHLYADEAPPAFLVAAEEARAEALSALGKDNSLAVAEDALASRTAFSLRQAAPPELLVGNDTYLTRNLGYDVPRRLANAQERSPEMYALDPDATLREGDRWASWGLVSAGIAGAAVIAAAVAAGVLRPPAWRRPHRPAFASCESRKSSRSRQPLRPMTVARCGATSSSSACSSSFRWGSSRRQAASSAPRPKRPAGQSS